MSKRTHDEFEESYDPYGTHRSHEVQRQRVHDFLNNAKLSLFRALRLARGFERQKLGRRQKAAVADRSDADLARINAEITALKGLDFTTITEIHLYKSLLKSKPISAAPALPQYVQTLVEETRPTPSAASVNVQARLFRTGPVKVAMDEIFGNIQEVLGIGDLKLGGKKRTRAKDYGTNAAESNAAQNVFQNEVFGNEKKHAPSARPKEIPMQDQAVATPQQDESAEKEEIKAIAKDEIQVTEKDTMPALENEELIKGPEVAFVTEDSRTRDGSEKINSSRQPASLAKVQFEDTGDGVREDDAIHYPRLAGSTDDDSAGPPDEDLHVGNIDSMSRLSTYETLEEASASTDLRLKKTPKRSTAALTSTTFLPSLSMGGYLSGSDIDSGEENAAKIQPRKNRMGQQARQALWEKKFGQNANHLKKQPRNRDQGWDARRGASGGNDRGNSGKGRGGRESGPRNSDRKGSERDYGGAGVGSGANSEPLKAKAKAKPEGALHPSWEAAKKAKAQKAVTAFQGKKVVFD